MLHTDANTKRREEHGKYRDDPGVHRASGYKLQYVARAMQISPNALGQKLQGHTQFKLNEAERLSAVLGLSMYERDLCFFEEQNRREALARRADEKRRGECDKRAEK